MKTRTALLILAVLFLPACASRKQTPLQTLFDLLNLPAEPEMDGRVWSGK